jgi:hypothetical protein
MLDRDEFPRLFSGARQQTAAPSKVGRLAEQEQWAPKDLPQSAFCRAFMAICHEGPRPRKKKQTSAAKSGTGIQQETAQGITDDALLR